MVVIGVTGGVGTGKSTVAKMFRELGAVVVDADAIAHQVMEPKRLAWRRIVDTFGEGILNEDQTIHRQRLASIVFTDAQRRKQLEAIIHPQVVRHIKQHLHRLKRNRRVKGVVLDVPLLIETGADRLVDALVVVTAPPDVQRERLARRYGVLEPVEARIASQWELSAKVALADYVVDNANGVDVTRTQVKRIWQQLGQRNRTRKGRSRRSRSPASRWPNSISQPSRR